MPFSASFCSGEEGEGLGMWHCGDHPDLKHSSRIWGFIIQGDVYMWGGRKEEGHFHLFTNLLDLFVLL